MESLQTVVEHLESAISRLAPFPVNQYEEEHKTSLHFACLTDEQNKLYQTARTKRRPHVASQEAAAIEEKNVQQLIQELELLFSSKFEKCRLVEEKVGSYLKEYKCLEEKQSKLEESIRSLENDDIHQSLESTINEWNEKEGNVRQELQALQTKYEENIQYKRQLELSVEEKKEQLEKAKQDRIKMEQLQEQIKTKQMELERITQLCEQEQDNLAELEDQVAAKLVSLQNLEQSKVSENEGQEYFVENLRLQHVCRELRATILERKDKKKEIIQKDQFLQSLLRTINQEVVGTSQREQLIEMLERRCSVLNALLRRVIQRYSLDGNLYASTIHLLLDHGGTMPLESLKEQLLLRQDALDEAETTRKRSQILQVIYTLVANSLVSIHRSQSNSPVSLEFSLEW
ncbi:hypothetical protein GAYE_PCTG75G1586 [Galdieria yellowstonensis]|uniref:Uncharacterized protein n=1 Tax=Galdieria yellowstonensis TaxID=3028027 RepID=A0AAV9I8I3_9RHOD|nr:hypothetical protein GAYE_PCTG75G1586 [Galdieria yellowstonensis]